MERLISYIDRYYNSKLVDEKLSEDEEKEFNLLDHFLKNFNPKDYRNVANYDKNELVLAFLTSYTKPSCFYLLEEMLVRLDFNNINIYHDCLDIGQSLERIVKDKDLDFIISLPYNFEDDEKLLSEVKEKGLYDEVLYIHSLLKKEIAKDDLQREAFLSIYDKFLNNFILCLMVSASLNDCKAKLSLSNLSDTDSNNIANFSSFSVSQAQVEENVRNTIDGAYVLKFLEQIKTKRDRIGQLPNERKKENSSQKRKKDKLLSVLKALKPDCQIEFTKSFIDSISNSRLEYFILKRAISCNLQLQRKTIEDLKRDKLISDIEKAFNKSCFSFSYLSDEERNNLSSYRSIDDIKKMLELFTESNISIYNRSFPIYDVLMTSKPSIVSSINKLIKGKLISPEFVSRNPSVFASKIDDNIFDKVNFDEGKYDVFDSNMRIFIENKYNTLSISKNSDLLIEDSNKNENIIEMLKKYSIIFKGNCYEIFNNPNLISIVDGYIELGLNDFIINNPRFISEKYIHYLDRFRLCKMLGISLLIDGKINPIITQDEFMIDKNVINTKDINDFIPNSVDRFIDPEMVFILDNSPFDGIDIDSSFIDRFSISANELNFDGVIISKNKFLRNHSILSKKYPNDSDKTIFNSLIYGSCLDESEIITISNMLGNNKKLKR